MYMCDINAIMIVQVKISYYSMFKFTLSIWYFSFVRQYYTYLITKYTFSNLSWRLWAIIYTRAIYSTLQKASFYSFISEYVRTRCKSSWFKNASGVCSI